MQRGIRAIYPLISAIASAVTQPSARPERTSTQPRSSLTIRTAAPDSSGPTAGARPCGDNRMVVWSSTTATGLRYQTRSPSPPSAATAAKIRSADQRSRCRGRSTQPIQPANQAKAPSSSSSSGVTGGDQVHPGRSHVGCRREPQRPKHGRLPRSQPPSPNPRGGGPAFGAEPVVCGSEVIPVRCDRRLQLGPSG